MEMTTQNLNRQETRTGEAARKALVPAVDIVETVEGITLTADLPGVAKENLAIGIEGDTLAIEGSVTLNEPAKLNPIYAEIRVAHYKRSFVLSRDLDTDKIDARLENGVLTLHIPKRERAKPRRVEVKA
jgi:HSP20 family protein